VVRHDSLAQQVIDHYRPLNVPVLLTFMTYYREIVQEPHNYTWKKRTMNSYWVISPDARDWLETELGVDGDMVRTCTTRESHYCRDCRNCENLYRRFQRVSW